ncbi:MAG: thermonuclease family protein [Coprobacillaceae bacterium]
MAKKKKIANKTMAKKLSKSWIGIVVLALLLGYQWFTSNRPIEPGERYEVTLVKCIDGDTARFNVDGEETVVRFLYIDTPESTKEVEPYGEEASAYVSERLTNANKIVLETNLDGDQYDKYDRMLAWVFVDGDLLQVDIAKNGYVEKFYDYGYDYTYKDEVIKADEEAKQNKVGLYE